jgi:Helix-turn-helix.
MAKNRIKEFRKAQKLTLNNLVELLAKKGIKVNESQLSKFEKGTSSPRSEEIWSALADVFDTSITNVMGFTSGDIKKITDPYFPTILSNFLKDIGKEKLSGEEALIYIETLGDNKDFLAYMSNELEKLTCDDVFITYNKKVSTTNINTKELEEINNNLNNRNKEKWLEYGKDLLKIQRLDEDKE